MIYFALSKRPILVKRSLFFCKTLVRQCAVLTQFDIHVKCSEHTLLILWVSAVTSLYRHLIIGNALVTVQLRCLTEICASEKNVVCFVKIDDGVKEKGEHRNISCPNFTR